MEKLEGMSLDLTKLNIEKLKELFPMIDVDGKIDFDMLRTILGDEVDDSREKYQFTWNGKTESIKLAQSPSSATLRPCKEESKDWDTTENLYIEGDNLEVLKQLQKTYYGKVKMIYIDPPYNTGNDFVYKDDFKDSIANYKEQTEQGMSSNPETNGRYHTDWLNMMYPRLILARNLLSQDGVIFISIDDNEQENLKKICNEIFGEDNFVANLVWEKKKKGSFLAKSITNIKEYILVFSKQKECFNGLIGEINTKKETYPCINATNKREIRKIPKGIISKFREKNYTLSKGSIISSNTMNLLLHSDLIIKDGYLAEELIVEGNWRYSQDAMEDYAIKQQLYITQDLYLRRIVNEPRYKTLKDLLYRVGKQEEDVEKKDNRNILTINIDDLFESGWGTNEDADEEIRILMGEQGLINYPKPVKLILKLMASFKEKDITIMDFFSGSSTTANAIIKLNTIDEGKRKFIMVQLPESFEKESIAYKSGYKNICDMGRKRIKKSGELIKKEYQESNPDKEFTTDIGFKVFKLDSTNIKPWENTNKLDVEQLSYLKEIFKKDRSKEDILYEILLKYGLFDMQVFKVYINGKTMYRVGRRYMIVCLEDNVNASDIKEIIELSPRVVVFKESGFNNDNDKINAEYNLKKAGIEEIKCI